ncbi:Hypothetical protein FKW44_009062 [Caligus rogercresseyi]|uniref:Uncharacterized protein n=1 Tax=Caligus rogercresseyi TaxID=217165 RepID=A0A7T8HF23_CALRO|nr:Hypothetical protein FKW44_009062 [Caligus rogercresseyi]
MAKTLCGLKLAELRNLCVELELVEGVEELEGKKKSEVVVLVREYLIACGCDPKTHDFARVSNRSLKRLHRRLRVPWE